jgi:DNA repair exonuclease SbcCD ATPase subunit
VIGVYNLDGDEFAAFGQNVPEPVEKALNAHVLCFASQHESSFLLGISKPEAARYLADLIGLSEMDSAQALVESARRRYVSRIELQEETEKEIETELARLEPVPAMQVSVQKIEALFESVSEETSRLEALEEALSQHTRITEALSKYLSLPSALKELEAIESLQTSVEGWKGSFNVIAGTISAYRRIQSKVIPRDVLDEADSSLSSIEKAAEAIKALELSLKSIQAEIQAYRDIQSRVDESRVELKRMEKQWKEETDGKVCPLCGGSQWQLV